MAEFEKQRSELAKLQANLKRDYSPDDETLRSKLHAAHQSFGWAAQVVANPPAGAAVNCKSCLRLGLAHALEVDPGALKKSSSLKTSQSALTSSTSLADGIPINNAEITAGGAHDYQEFVKYSSQSSIPINNVEYQKLLSFVKPQGRNFAGKKGLPSIANNRKNIGNHSRFDYQCLPPTCGSYGARIAVYLKPRGIHFVDEHEMIKDKVNPTAAQNSSTEFPPYALPMPGDVTDVDFQDIIDISHACEYESLLHSAILGAGAKANVAGSKFGQSYLRMHSDAAMMPPSSHSCKMGSGMHPSQGRVTIKMQRSSRSLLALVDIIHIDMPMLIGLPTLAKWGSVINTVTQQAHMLHLNRVM